jgi:hypothetical protein
VICDLKFKHKFLGTDYSAKSKAAGYKVKNIPHKYRAGGTTGIGVVVENESMYYIN